MAILGLDLIPNWWRDWSAPSRPIGSLAEEIEEYERRDQTRTRLLAWSVAAWFVALSLVRPLESALFGVALFIVVYRLPASLRVARAALRSPVWILLVGYLVVAGVSTALSPQAATASTILPNRAFAVPFLVLPVLGRWRLLLAGLVVGAFLQALLAVVAVLIGRDPQLTDNGSSTYLALAAAGAALACAPGRARPIAGAAAISTALFAQAHASVRAGFAGIAAGIAVIVAGAGWRARVTALAIAVAAGAIVLAAAPRGESPAASIVPRASALDYESLNEYSSNRLEMWRLTLHASLEHPLLGHGRNAWRSVIDAMRPDDASLPRGAELIWTHRAVGYSHNTAVDAVFESGILGAGMLAAATALLVRRAWPRSPASIAARLAFAVFVAAIVLALFDNVFERFIPGSLLIGSACVALGPSVERARPAFRGRDARVDRLLGD